MKHRAYVAMALLHTEAYWVHIEYVSSAWLTGQERTDTSDSFRVIRLLAGYDRFKAD